MIDNFFRKGGMAVDMRISLCTGFLALWGVYVQGAVTNDAGQEQWIQSYNTLVHLYDERVLAAGLTNLVLPEKDPSSSNLTARIVSQSDLNVMRSNVITLLSEHYGRLDESTGDILWLLPNGGSNFFTKVSGQHRGNGVPWLTNTFTDVPLIWTHFAEIYTNLVRMTNTVVSGTWTSCGESNNRTGFLGEESETPNWTAQRDYVESSFDNYISSTNLPPMGWTERNFESSFSPYSSHSYMVRRYAYFVVTNVTTSISHTLSFYCRATQPDDLGLGDWDDNGDSLSNNIWFAWDSSSANSSSYTSAALGDVTLDRPNWCGIPSSGELLRGYAVSGAVALVRWNFSAIPLFEEPPSASDVDVDGLLDQGDCGCSGSCKLDFRPTWRSNRGECVDAMLNLGSSTPHESGGLSVSAYLNEYKVGNTRRQMLSLDTAIMSHSINNNEGWEFVLIKRPSGAEVLFPLTGVNAGLPVGLELEMDYTVTKVTNSQFRLEFNDSARTVHEFNSNGIIHAVSVMRGGVSNVLATNDWLGMKTFTNSSGEITSNVTAAAVAYPVYSNGLIRTVVFREPDGGYLQTVTAEWGSRIYTTIGSGGDPEPQTRVVTNKNATEIWYGVLTNSSGAVSSIGKKEIRSETYGSSSSIITVRQVNVLYSGTTPVTGGSNVTIRVLKVFPWGEELISETIDPSGANLITTYTYGTNSSDDNNYGRLALVEYPNGGWSRFTYDSEGRQKTVRAPFENSAPTVTNTECRETVYTYYGDSALTSADFPVAADVGTDSDPNPRMVVEKVLGTEVSRQYFAYMEGSNVSVQAVAPSADFTHSSNLVSLTRINTTGDNKGRVSRSENPDGTVSIYTYEFDDVEDELTTTVRTGPLTGTNVLDGTETISVVNAAGWQLSTQTRDVRSEVLLSDVVYSHDGYGRTLTTTNHVTGEYTVDNYGCCGVSDQTGADGVVVETDYDDLKQVFARTRLGVTTYFEYDVDGNVIAQIREAGGQSIETRNSFDHAGRPKAETNELGKVTSYIYSTNAVGASVVKTVYADAGYKVETYYRDGQLSSVTGTAVYATCYDYGVEDGLEFSAVYQGPTTSASEWTKSYSQMGRSVKSTAPGYSVSTTYNDLGQVVKQSDGFTTNLMSYNGKGEAFRSAVDMDGSGSISAASADRLAEATNDVITLNSTNVRRSISYIYATNGVGTATKVSESYSTLDGLASWSISFDRTSQRLLSRNRSSASRVGTNIAPDQTKTVSSYTNGLLRSVVSLNSSGGTVSSRSFTYDSFLRLAKTTETAANGETRTITNLYNAASMVTGRIVMAGSLMQASYTVFDVMGRPTTNVAPDGGAVTNTFNTKGELVQQAGARTYPVTYTYTDGRMETLSTYQNGLGNTSNTTTWLYDSGRGWMTAKIYADGSSNVYAYRADGKLQTRTWARGVTSSYSYGSAGDLSVVNYSDSTPDITNTVDRLGRVTKVADGVGDCLFFYGSDGSLTSNSVPQVSGYSLMYTRDNLGRLTDTELSAGGTTAMLTSYGFDSAGRLSTIDDTMTTATYTYGPDGSTWTNLSLGGPLNVKRTFDGLNRLSQISNQPQAASPISFSYALNTANQRTTNTLADGSQWRYEYDSLGQVTSGKKYFSGGVAVGGAQFEYNFDTIGNRTSALEGDASSSPSSYTANNLNQYSSRNVLGKILITGTASNQAVVSARFGTNSLAQYATKQSTNYFWTSLAATNTAAIFWTNDVRITAYMTQVVAGVTSSLVKTESREAILAKTPEAFTHDLDGNLLIDGLWTNTWSGENRLLTMESVAGVPNPAKKKLTFTYDYMGRRTTKKVESAYNGSAYATTNSMTFVWNGWNIIAAVGTGYTNTMTWGLDLSGSLQGAGGVGGLIAETINGTNCYPIMDGGGNVMGLVNTSGVVVAEYEYSPAGVELKAIGPLAQANHWRYSTKYTDQETGWVQYELRPYIPHLQRFVGKDPVGELAYPNLYVFLGNDAINQVDVLGLWAYERFTDQEMTVVTAEDGDTIKTLAEKIGLRADEFDKWLSAMTEGGLLPSSSTEASEVGCQYKIPNTIVAWWSGDVGFLGKGFVDWDTFIQNIKADGYHVSEGKSQEGRHLAFQGAIESLTKNRSLHGAVFQGHGGTEVLGSGGWMPGIAPSVDELYFDEVPVRNSSGRLVYTIPGVNPSYKLGFVMLLACESKVGRNVLFAGSPGGVFLGFEGTMIPGVNTSTGGTSTYGDPWKYLQRTPDPQMPTGEDDNGTGVLPVFRWRF